MASMASYSKNRKFYINTVTKESVWEHPNERVEKESPSKSQKVSRKRKECDQLKNEEPDVEKMEVDVTPPPKGIAEEVQEAEESSSKRYRKSECPKTVDLPLRAQNTTEKVLPVVPWSPRVRPYNRITYHACAIFDTCALIKHPNALDSSVKKQILTVVPYVVLSELDGLKNNEGSRRAANAVSQRLKALQEQHEYYLRVETSIEENIQIDNFLPNESVKDDSILKCALRVKKEVMSICSALKLNERDIFLVSNDSVLSNKAMTHDLTVETSESFIDFSNERKSKPYNSHNQIEKRSTCSITSDSSYRKSRDQSTSKSAEDNYKKAVAIESVKSKRETMRWIKNMVYPEIVQKCSSVQNNTSKTSNKSRPSIPLEDKLVPPPKVDRTKRSQSFPRKNAYNNKTEKSLESNTNRPKMPYSFSDEESDVGDKMDCS
uniref:WW domain-containing protein n=2 Tax=Caenorhabditis tropicalis TaxID=1561998 RepID=A0A1I7UUB5_9PELO